MSSFENNNSYNPKSNALKNILKNPKEEKKTFGKEEFLARRRYFLEKLESEGGVPKPKPFISNSSSKKKSSNEKIKTSINKNINSSNNNSKNVTTNNIKNSTTTNNIKNSTTNNKIASNSNEKVTLPTNEWSIINPKSESLKKILSLAEKKDANTVGKNVFNARQKFFADSQLSSVDQLMPRPSTPPGFCYFERCPSPSMEPVRRNSYGLYSSTSPALSSSSVLSSSPSLSSKSPSLSSSTYSLPWEYGNNKKKDNTQPKPQKSSTKVIESLESRPLISKEVIKLPDPIIFKKEIISIEQPMTIQTEIVKELKPMIPKLFIALPEPVHFTIQSLPVNELITFNTIRVEKIEPQLPKHIFIEEKLPEPVKFEKESLPLDEPIEVITEFIKMPEVCIPKIIMFLPEPVTFKKELLPQDKMLEVKIETIKVGEKQLPKLVTFLPEPIKTTKELLPQDKPLEIKTELVISEDKQFPKIAKIEEEIYKNENELKTNLIKTTDISSLALESNIEEKKEIKKFNDGLLNNYYPTETQPLIDFDNEIAETKIELNEEQPLLNYNNEEVINVSNESKPLLSEYEEKPLIDFDTEDFNNNITENTLISFDESPVNDNETLNKKSSISSISELLNNNGTLSLDEPLPRKSIPTYGDENVVDDLIEFSESEMSDKVKNWYNVVQTAITKEENIKENN